jgi:two-component system sensor histidine kinase/response regulator
MKRDILYVDDEPDNIVVFEAAFEDDFNVFTAESGKQALEMIERHPVPVVVADQRMPNMTGVELCEELRDRFPVTKRIILTGNSDPDAMVDAINRGQVFHYVKKPWERSFLFSVLIRALEAYDLEMANSALTNRLVTSERYALLGQVTGSVAHEMGNQLCMLPLIEMIEDDYSDDEDLMKVSRFARETYERLEALIREVKDFMRFEQEDFVRHPVALPSIVHELISFLRFSEDIPREKLKLEIRAEPVVLANKIKLQQVLINLLKNATDAISNQPDGRISLVVDVEDSHATISVTDNGHGMTPETLSRIWEPYFSTKGDQGNGMGLDISRKLIESHGGEITCQSALNQGATFVIRLPVVNQQTEEAFVPHLNVDHTEPMPEPVCG